MINGVRTVIDTIYRDTIPVFDDRIQEGQVSITVSTGEKVDGNIFRTSSGAGSTISFIAKIGNVSSQPGVVKLVDKTPVDFEPITIPVIFHFLYKNGDQHAANGATTAFLDNMLTRINKVFAGTLIKTPSSLDTKIQFVLARESPDGTLLAERGSTNKILARYPYRK